MSGRALEQRLERFLVEHPRVDRLFVQLAKSDERRERDATVSAAEGTVHQQRKKKRRDLVRERRIRLAPEGRDLRPLDSVDQTELRIDNAGMRRCAAELEADSPVNLDEILNRQVARAAAVSR